jgi:hypothetical protein
MCGRQHKIQAGLVMSNETTAKTHLGRKIAQKSDLEIPKCLEIIFRVG